MKRMLLGAVIAMALMACLLARVELPQVWKALTAADGRVLASAIGLKGIAYFLRARRWAFAIESATGRPLQARVFAASMIGYATNLVVPARMGDLARVEVLSRHNQVSRALALTSFWLTALVDYGLLASSLIVLILAGALSGFSAPRFSVLAVAVAAGAAMVAGRMAHHRAAAFAADWLAARLPGAVVHHLTGAVSNVRQSLQLLKSPRDFLVVCGLSAAIWFVEIGATGLALASFQLPRTALASTAVTIALSLSSAFPVTPGNVGTHQAVSVLVLKAFGVAETSALAFSIGMQGAVMVLLIGVGAAFSVREGVSLFRPHGAAGE